MTFRQNGRSNGRIVAQTKNREDGRTNGHAGDGILGNVGKTDELTAIVGRTDGRTDEPTSHPPQYSETSQSSILSADLLRSSTLRFTLSRATSERPKLAGTIAYWFRAILSSQATTFLAWPG